MGKNGIVKSGATSGEDADIELDFSGTNNPDIAGKLVAERDIKINVGVATPNQIGEEGNVTLWAGETLEINNTLETPQIKGDIIGIEEVNFTGTSQINLNGSIISKGKINFPENLTININATNSQRKGAIVLFNENDNTTLCLDTQSDLNITVGDNQVGGIIVYFDNVSQTGTGKVSNITISGNINFTDDENNKFLLINRSERGSITIDASGKKVNGSIYSAYYNLLLPLPSITLNNGTLNGSIITNGTVNLNGGSVIYNPLPYKNSTGDIYKGFVGGRRVYLPVPGSWRIEW